MPTLPTLSDRAWYAYNALVRGDAGELPSYSELERSNKLSHGILSRVFRGERCSALEYTTLSRLARALGVTEHWLQHGGNDGPAKAPEPVPPRPGARWSLHGELPGWKNACKLARRLDGVGLVPREAYLAGAELCVYRPIEEVTAEIALAVSAYAWFTASRDERARLTTAYVSSYGRAADDDEARAETPQGKTKRVARASK